MLIQKIKKINIFIKITLRLLFASRGSYVYVYFHMCTDMKRYAPA